MIIYYAVLFAATVILGMIYAYKWHKHCDVHITLLFLITPIVNLGYLLLSVSKNLGEALIANKITYIGGCYLLLMILYSIFSLCKIKLPVWARSVLLGISSIVYVFALSEGYSSVFYKSVNFEIVDGVGVLTNKEYGFMHTVFLVMVVSYFLLSVAAIIYAYIKNRQVSRKTLFLLLTITTIGVVSFIVGKSIKSNMELIPVAYVLALSVFVIIIDRINLYDISETAIESIIERGDTGFLSIGFNNDYLGSNETAKNILPELNELIVDRKISDNQKIYETVNPWIEKFKSNQADRIYFEKDDKTYLVTVNYLMNGKRKGGYQFTFTDDTKDQEYIKLINSFNTELQNEVEAKTKHIIEMSDRFILGIATMVESRDNSTGGHINRTRKGVKMLIEEMMKDNSLNLSLSFCSNVIKAAPMHDLGKVTVDDSILRKPGKLTPEEYEKMKTHAAEGAKIIESLLAKSDDLEFKNIAINVAHYHHEKYDGTGYPDGLKGDNIPLEARIMAIADYYDAIASKRAYKDKVSPEETYEIIMSKMGTHFDPKLKPYLEAAKDKFKDYYNSVE